MLRLARILAWSVAGVLGLAAAIVVGGWLWLLTSLPQLDGEAALPGLDAAVTVERDELGVPRIEAESTADAVRALGYVHAQDRLAQMETMRRIAAGRLAEVVGDYVLGMDRRMRTYGLARLAQDDFDALPPDVQAVYEAYADGVNAYLEGHSGAWPPEMALMRVEPEPWEPWHSLVWNRMMALRLSGNWQAEMRRFARLRDTTEGEAGLSRPSGMDGAPVSIPGPYPPRRTARVAAPPPPPPPDRFVPEGDPLRDPDGGSNIWAIGPEKSTTGAPVLANDPHLGLGAPGYWYVVDVHTPKLRLTGATAPGVPALILGHNGHVAWGLTTPYTDTSDLFIERVDTDDPERYLVPGGNEPFELREETIEVRFGEPVTHTVRSTRHGPVIQEVDDEHVLALAHTGLLPRDPTATALWRVSEARTAADLLDALAFVRAPQQNVAFADTEGTIGLVLTGAIPDRPKGAGRLPTPGWTDENDWERFVPFDALPRILAPEDDVIMNANNRLVDDDFPYWLGDDWAEPWRAMRLTELLQGPQTFERQSAIQLERTSIPMRRLRDALLSDATRPEADPALLDALERWDGVMWPDAPEPLVMQAWLRELGPRLDPEHGRSVGRVLSILAGGEDRARDIQEALDRALADLRERYGDDWREWRWSDAHITRFRHTPLSRIPLLGPLFTPSVPMGGGSHTIDRGGMNTGDPDEPYARIHGAGYRAVYDLSDLDRSLIVQAPGQSGNPLSRYYRDLLWHWQANTGLPLGDAYEPKHRLTLLPAGGDGE